MSTSRRHSRIPSDQSAGSSERLVTVSPRSGRNEVNVKSDGVITVRVTAPPVDGEANAAVVQTLADAFGLAKSSVVIVRGATSRQKLVRFAMPEAELAQRLSVLAGIATD